jgi:hypothetical protein
MGTSWCALTIRELYRRWLRLSWRSAVCFLLTESVIAVPAVVFTHGVVRGFVLGLLAAGLPAVIAYVAIATSGAGPLNIGRVAERATNAELAPFRRTGGRVMWNLVLGRDGDIDHVVVAPAGVFVIETKWRRQVVHREIEAAARQADLGRRRVNGLVRPTIGGVRVRAVVVVRGPAQPELLPPQVDDVLVLHARDFGAWVRTCGREAVLEPAQVDGAWDRLERNAALREQYERRNAKDGTRTLRHSPARLPRPQAIEQSEQEQASALG